MLNRYQRTYRMTLSSRKLTICLCVVILALAVTGTGYRSWFSLHTDFANFYDVGHKVLAGELENLFQTGVPIEGKPPQGHMAFYATPIAASLYAPLALMPPETAVVVFRAVCTLLISLGIWFLYREYRPWGAASFGSATRFTNLFLIAILLWQPFWNIYLFGGQSTALTFVLMVIAINWHVRKRSWLTVIALCLACAIKPALVAILILLVIARWREYAGKTAVVALSLLAASVVLMGVPVHIDFLLRRILHPLPPTDVDSSWVWNVGLSASIDSLAWATSPVSRGVRSTIGSVLRLSTAGVLFWLSLKARIRTGSDWDRRHEFHSALICGFLLIPIVFDHYLQLLFIPAAFWLACRATTESMKCLLPCIFLAALAQNTEIYLKLNETFRPDNAALLFALGLFRSLPLILIASLHAFQCCSVIAVELPSLSTGGPETGSLRSSI